MEKFKDDEIDREFFKNDFYVDQLESPEDIERYKSGMRDTYNYASYRLNMTMSPYKLAIKDFVVDGTYKIVNGLNKILEFIVQRIEK